MKEQVESRQKKETSQKGRKLKTDFFYNYGNQYQ